MKIRKMMMIIVFVGLAFSSCKNQDSKETSTETDIIESEDIVTETDKRDIVDKVKNYLTTEYLSEADLRAISQDQRKFQIYEIDLNNDGKNEVFVNFNTPYFCGTGGCTLLLLSNQVKLITEFTVTSTPLYIDKSVENGWRPILTKSEGKWRKLIYKDGSYPSNPSVVKASSDAPNERAEILFEDNNNLKAHSF